MEAHRSGGVGVWNRLNAASSTAAWNLENGTRIASRLQTREKCARRCGRERVASPATCYFFVTVLLAYPKHVLRDNSGWRWYELHPSTRGANATVMSAMLDFLLSLFVTSLCNPNNAYVVARKLSMPKAPVSSMPTFRPSP